VKYGYTAYGAGNGLKGMPHKLSFIS